MDVGMLEVDRDLRDLMTSAGPDSCRPHDRERASALRRRLLELSVEASSIASGRRTSDGATVRCPTWDDHEWRGSRVIATGHDQDGNYSVVASRCARCGFGLRSMERPESPSLALPADTKSWQGGQ